MCTLSVIPLLHGGLRVAFNRDERPTRTAGLPPELKRFESRNALFPIDPSSGGTWLAVNDAALVVAVLNANPPQKFTAKPARSRGEIIPAILSCDSPAQALEQFQRRFDHSEFAPFQLVLIGQGLVAHMRWNGSEQMVTSRLLGGSPMMFTSSGLGDHLVEDIRRELFESFFDSPVDKWAESQEAFHRHTWPGREHLSVNMTRASARTVSYSVMELHDDRAEFHYQCEPFDTRTETVAVLPFQVAGVV